MPECEGWAHEKARNAGLKPGATKTKAKAKASLSSTGGFGAAKKFVDALGVLFGAVEDEHKFGGAAELETLAELVADEAGGGGEGFDGVPLFVFGAHDADVDLGLFEVGRHAHFGDGGEDGETRVFQFAGEHGADFLADFAGDPFVAMSCDGHMAKTKSRFLVAVAPRNDNSNAYYGVTLTVMTFDLTVPLIRSSNSDQTLPLTSSTFDSSLIREIASSNDSWTTYFPGALRS
jgi:hypothetical protein